LSKTVFMFAGQGSQYYGMGRELLADSPVFASSMLRLNGIFQDAGLPDVFAEIYREDRKASDPFDQLEFTHPAILLIELSLLEVMRQEGVVPDLLLGASLGEFAAAAAAGTIDVGDLATSIARQVELVRQHCPPGGMLAVFDDSDSYQQGGRLPPGCEVAAVNSDRHLVLSGSPTDIDRAAVTLGSRRVTHQRLAVGFAFHSIRMDAAAGPYLESLDHLRIGTPQIPLVSCATADIVDEFSVQHLWQMVRSPIRFRDAVRLVERRYGDATLVDLGPSGTLANLAAQNLAPGSAVRTLAVLNPFAPAGRAIEQLGSLRPARRSAVDPPTSGLRTPTQAPGGARMKALVFPGQGSQRRGMGDTLFAEFPDLTSQADEILGYSVAELCRADPDGNLGRTQYTQPALYVVNALTHLRRSREVSEAVDFVAGHSLGEYNALFAAGAFDFGTGLRLVRRRGELMARVTGGGMAAVIGLGEEAIREALAGGGLESLDLANLNSHDQVVLSGPAAAIAEAKAALLAAGASAYIPLRVSGAFHSRYMEPARQDFETFLASFEFRPLKIPVIANITARPYEEGQLRQTLAAQLVRPVRWEQTVRYLLAEGAQDIEEVGPGRVLTGLVTKIREAVTPVPESRPRAVAALPPARTTAEVASTPASRTPDLTFEANTLGSAAFRETYGVRYSYVCGSMYRGISSPDLVIRAGRAGVLAFFGSGGLPPGQVESAVGRIRAALGPAGPYGVSLVHDPVLPATEDRTVDVLLAAGVVNIEASAFMKVTPALVRYRLRGLTERPDGTVVAGNRVIAKLSRPEVAESFLSPAPDRLVRALVNEGRITADQARLAGRVPMADDICVEADSGGHTDRRDSLVLLPTIRRLRDRKTTEYGYRATVRVGAAGGIGTPEAAAAVFLLGADFVVTGSINLCTVESGTSPLVKDLLEQVNIQDTDYAPAGDMFELGAQVQVLKRGVFFPARARKLHELYRRHDSLDEIDAATREQIETRYFRRSFDEVWQQTRAYFAERDPQEITKAEQHPKHKMALVFRWYFAHSQRAAMEGAEAYRLDFQVHCGPSLGAFNQWVAGTPLQSWRNRHVDDLAERMMSGAASYLRQRFEELAAAGARS
jgi:trans-AT polyketide synthase/acyltransferase/oxidoreductase domain-containing protein